MPSNDTITYPFVEISERHQYRFPDIRCMICGYKDAGTSFRPRKQAKNTISIGYVMIPVPGTKHNNMICCPRCLALGERGLGSMIHNFMAGEAIHVDA